MRTPPTLDTLHALQLLGRSPALLEPRPMPEMTAVPCADRRGRLGERERPAREARRLKPRVPKAQLRPTACSEDLASRQPRGVDTSLLRRVAPGQWGRARPNVLITGPTGSGHTWGACARGHPACRQGWTGLALRRPRLLQACPLATGHGREGKRMTAWANTAGLMLDAWGLAPRRDDRRRDFVARREDRQDCRATLVTRQRPGEHWHEAMGEPPLAEALLDRLVHNAAKRALQGASRRQRQAPVPTHAPSVSGRHAPQRVALQRPTRCGAAWPSWGRWHRL